MITRIARITIFVSLFFLLAGSPYVQDLAAKPADTADKPLGANGEIGDFSSSFDPTSPEGVDRFANARIAGIEKGIRLTDAQKASIRRRTERLCSSLKTILMQENAILQPALARLEAARAAGDARAIARAQKEISDSQAAYSDAIRQWCVDTDNVLTPEQKREVKEKAAAVLVDALTDPVKLDEARFKAIKARYDALKATSKTEEMANEKVPSLILPVLTPEEKTTIMKARVRKFCAELARSHHPTPAELKKVEAVGDDIARSARFEDNWPYFESVKSALLPRVDGVFPSKQEPPTTTFEFRSDPPATRPGVSPATPRPIR